MTSLPPFQIIDLDKFNLDRYDDIIYNNPNPTYTLNYGFLGTPSTSFESGIIINRGTLTDATILWDESKNFFKAGLLASEKRIACIEDTPDVNGIPYWLGTSDNRFETNSSQLCIIPLTGNVGIGTNSPSFLLDVNGTSRTSSLITTGNVGIGTNSVPTSSILQIINNSSRYPPTAISSATTVIANTQFTATVSGVYYGTGTYTFTSSSSASGTLVPWKLFDRITNTTSYWQPAGTPYGTSNGIYIGTSISTTYGSTTYYGEWVQIQLPLSIILTSFTITASAFGAVNAPRDFILVGSSDGTTWTLIGSAYTNESFTQSQTKTYTLSSNSTSYSYYRLAINGKATTGTGYLDFTEWALYSNTSLLTVNTNGETIFGAVGSERMEIDPNGNVGIGTNMPSTLLHILSSSTDTIQTIQTNGASKNSILRLFSSYDGDITNSGNAIIQFGNKNTGGILPDNSWYMGLDRGGGVNAFDPPFKIGFKPSDWGTVGDNDLLTISTSGNVGIGSNMPSFLLDVNGESEMNKISTCANINNNTTRPTISITTVNGEIHAYGCGTTTILSKTADDGFLRLSAGGGTNTSNKSYIDISGLSQQADMNRNIVFGTAGTERMRIDLNGTVGIGTNAPTSGFLLDVNDESKTSKISTCANINGTSSTSRPTLTTTTINGEIHSYGCGSSTILSKTADDGFLRLSAGGGTSTSNKSYIDISGIYSNASDMDRNIVFGTAGTERMRIDLNGNLDIASGFLTFNTSIRGIRARATGTGTGDSILDNDLVTNIGTSVATEGLLIRYFRVTNTTGPCRLQYFIGTNTGTINAQIGCNNGLPTYFCANNGNFGIGTSTPNTSAILDLTSTTKALLLPRATSISGTPVNGMIYYDSTNNLLKAYISGAWRTITTTA